MKYFKDIDRRTLLIRLGIALTGMIVIFFLMTFLSKELSEVEGSPIVNLFQSEPYISLVRRMHSFNRILLTGDERDGLYLFAEHYANLNETSQNYKVIRKKLSSSLLQFKTEKNSQSFFDKVSQFFRSSNDANKKLWLLDNGQNEVKDINLDIISSMIIKHPEDKFIIISKSTYEQVIIGDMKIYGFMLLVYEKPKETKIKKLFGQQVKNKLLVDNIVKYYRGDVRYLNSLLRNLQIVEQFQEKYQKERYNLEKLMGDGSPQGTALTNILKKLCKSGVVKHKKIEKEQQIVQWQGDNCYWTDFHYIYAYSHLTDTPCQFQTQISSYVMTPEDKKKSKRVDKKSKKK